MPCVVDNLRVSSNRYAAGAVRKEIVPPIAIDKGIATWSLFDTCSHTIGARRKRSMTVDHHRLADGRIES